MPVELAAEGLMFEYLQPSALPIVKELEALEIVYAATQSDVYNPLRVLRSNDRDGQCMSRWTFTDEQRQAISAGADVYLEMSTFHRPLTPVRMAVSDGIDPAIVLAGYKLV